MLIATMTPDCTLSINTRTGGLTDIAIKAAVNAVLETCELFPLRKVLACQLDSASLRALCLGMAALTDTHCALLDQPSPSTLDIVSKRGIWQIVQRLFSGKALLIATPSVTEAETLCERIGTNSVLTQY